jgi:hypothetical protein
VVRRIALLLAAASLTSLLAACEIASTTVPRTDSEVIVHAILDPGRRVQTFVIEQSLTGAQAVVDSGPYDPSNPVRSGNGVPIGGAIVVLAGPGGASITASEVRTSGANASGLYTLDLISWFDPATGTYARLGETYTLTVNAGTKTVTGTTVVPMATPFGSITRSTFNRDHDSVTIAVRDVSLARAYWVRVDAPVAPYSILSFDQEFNLSGQARNLFTQELVRVFFPGFLQTVTVAAVDTNVYDYYRSGSDPFSGAGLITHLEGGLGVFGSAVVIDKRVLDVTQDATGDSVEAVYTLRAASVVTPAMPRQMRLFLESKGPTESSGDRISGSYATSFTPSAPRSAVFGYRTGNSFELQILEGQTTARINSVFKASVHGDTIRGFFSNGTSANYVKAGR